jgi:hypothetical protein
VPGLAALTFDLTRSGAGSTVPVRRDLSHRAAWPEWQAGVTQESGDSAVAYAISRLAAAPPTVGVTLTRGVGDPTRVEVRALAPLTDTAPWPPAVLAPPDLLWPASYWFTSPQEYLDSVLYAAYYRQWQASRERQQHAFGPVPAVGVSFGGDGIGTVVAPLPGHTLGDRGVNVSDVTWQWQTRTAPGQPWLPLATTQHRVYTILAPPTLPWHPRPQAADDTQVAWTAALDIACRWASGARDERAAATSVTEAVNGLGGLIEYGCPIGALTMYAAPLGLDAFDCSGFLELLEGGPGNGRFVNCSDCATFVSTFANLLGGDLWQSRMGSYVPSFETNPLLAIGATRVGSPCGWGLGFTYHEVAWTAGCGAADSVYDACCRLNTPGGGASTVLPVDMRFGLEGQGQYLDLMAAPTTRAACQPRPGERKRRSLL